jgi:hypothetical protein
LQRPGVAARTPRVFATDGTETFFRARHWRMGLPVVRPPPDKTGDCWTVYTGRSGGVADPVFGLPLWLQKSCCSGKLLWAYNLDHLSFVESCRRRHPRMFRCGPGGRRMFMAPKLPSWLKSAERRDEILRAVQQLKRSIISAP